MSSTSTIQLQNQQKQPSEKLIEKIKFCASAFKSLTVTVNELIELGKEEGFTPKEIGNFIREEMLKSGLSRMTVTRYLPVELKAKPRGNPRKFSNILLLNKNETKQGLIIQFKCKVSKSATMSCPSLTYLYKNIRRSLLSHCL
jgi:hypothetical protein